ncbi:MAG: capsule polysaccharide transporter, partial [Campylobacterales bacterium]|nr:capsule polysaccharide transporter [Campylobacterales bacterium]
MIIGYLYYLNNLIQMFSSKNFKGWGRKKTGRFATWCHERFGGTLTLEEDGFIRSLSLGVDGSPSFSLVEDDIGIYYDATAPS